MKALSARPASRSVLLIGLVVFLVSTTSVAVAKQPERETHCVVTVTGQRDSGEFITTKPDCYRTFAESIQAATGGAVNLAPDAQGSVVFDPGFVALGGTPTLGIHYSGYNGGGSSITVLGSVCSGGWWNTTASWDNRISSSWNGCYRLKHFDLPNKGGSSGSTYGVGDTDNVPSWIDNKAESVQYLSS